MNLKPQRIAIFLNGHAKLTDLTEGPAFYVPFKDCFPLKAPGWTFVNSFNCEVWPKSGWVEVKATGLILDFVDPNTLPELLIETEVRGELDYQTAKVVWSSHRGQVTRALVREFDRNIDGTLTRNQILMKEAKLRILVDGHGTRRISGGGTHNFSAQIAETQLELATGRRSAAW